MANNYYYYVVIIVIIIINSNTMYLYVHKSLCVLPACKHLFTVGALCRINM